MTPAAIVSQIQDNGAQLVLRNGHLKLIGGAQLPAELLTVVRSSALELHLWLRGEESYQDAMGAWRRRHGVQGARDTGPATHDELAAAQAMYGHPLTHDEWLAAVDARRKEGGPSWVA